ncbi:MAG: BMP family lipoprotein [Bacillota bacterium]
MKKTALVLMLALSFILLTGYGAAAQNQIAINFATGGLGDQSFNDAAYRGMERAEEELGITFDYTEPESIADYETFLNQFAAQGMYDLIIAIGFDQADAVETISQRNPDQMFAIVDTVVEAENVASFVYEEKERGFLMGAAAAMMTTRTDDPFINEAKEIGVIGGMNIPLINANIAGYIAGAEFVDPEIEVNYSYVGDWADPGRGKELAVSMIEDDIDVIWGAAGRSGLGVLRAAEENDIYGIGADSDQSHVAPDHVLTNGMKFVDQTVYLAIQQQLEDELSPGVNVLGVEEGALGFTENLLPDDVVEELKQISAWIAADEIEIPDTIEAATE